MNIYLLWYLLCDRNKNILNDMNSNNTNNNKVKNTFNIKTISIIKKICEIKENGVDDIINKYNNYFSNIILEELEKSFTQNDIGRNLNYLAQTINQYENIDNIHSKLEHAQDLIHDNRVSEAIEIIDNI